MYSGKAKKTAKGVKESVKDRDIKHRDFKDCLFNKVPQQHSKMGFRSDLHWGTRFQFLRLLVSGPYFSLPLITKSLVHLFLIPGVLAFPIFVDPFPVVFAVLSSVISVVFLVLWTIGSLAADESFLVNFIPSFTSSFDNLDVLCSPSLLPS